ncbi:ABC transporter substrate-binding protein [Cohnella faecalis]|uniref:ABC transporter substrate-binding protein n=1 Tax=Cohnella faecalis TaxID=2315694 RepID=A0A398CGP7_9BACL|nr:ABC transporter substrate-binding protein [Cohnella faecalis]
MNVRRAGKLIVLCTVLCAGLLAACSSDNDSAGPPAATAPASSEAPSAVESSAQASAAVYPQSFQDELGHEVKLPAAPVRIFAPGLEDSLLVLGVTPVAQWANGNVVPAYLQERMASVPKADFAAGLPTPETVMSYAPDLIVLNNSYYAENGVYEKYAKIAPTYVFSNAATDIETSLRKLGELFGKSAEAETALEDYRSKVDQAKTKLAAAADGKKAVIIRFNARGMFLLGGDYYGGYVLAHDLGFGKIKLVEHESSADLSLEILPELDADYIFLVNDSQTGNAFLKELTESALWKGMKQVKNGNVYEVQDESWLYGGLIASGNVIDETVRLLAP